MNKFFDALINFATHIEEIIEEGNLICYKWNEWIKGENNERISVNKKLFIKKSYLAIFY